MTQQPLIMITGAKVTLAKRHFTSQFGQIEYLTYQGQHYKMNAAAGVVKQLAGQYELLVVGYQPDDAALFAETCGLPTDRFIPADLRRAADIERTASQAAALQQELGAPLYVVHYGGASDTKTALPHNSLLAHTWDMEAAAIPDLVENNCVTLVKLLQALRQHGVFARQPYTKVMSITAAAAVRAKAHLGLDVAQKAAGHGLLRSIALDLTPENIFITEIMPGSTDTGFFDNDYTMDEAIRVTRDLGYDKTPETYPLFTAEQIGDAVKYVITAQCNVREIALLPYGQFPHLGA